MSQTKISVSEIQGKSLCFQSFQVPVHLELDLYIEFKVGEHPNTNYPKSNS